METKLLRGLLKELQAGLEQRTPLGIGQPGDIAGLVAFLSPIARAILGLHIGETAVLNAVRGEEELQVVAVAYEGA